MTDHHLVKPIPVSSLLYRPRDYFGRYDLQAQLLTSVKGRISASNPRPLT